MRLEIRDQDSVTLPWKADDDFGIEHRHAHCCTGRRNFLRIRLNAPEQRKRPSEVVGLSPSKRTHSGVESVELCGSGQITMPQPEEI